VTAFCVRGGHDPIQADRLNQTEGFQSNAATVARQKSLENETTEKKRKKVKNIIIDKKTEGGRQTKTEDKYRRQEGQ
jgi:hypothetical protein